MRNGSTIPDETGLHHRRPASTHPKGLIHAMSTNTKRATSKTTEPST